MTYPGYSASLVLHKSLDYVTTQAGSSEFAHRSVTASGLGRILRPWGVWLLLTATVLALWLGSERRRTFLLAWPAFLSLPVFVVFQSSGGRFVTYVTASLVLAALPYLLDRDFYATVRSHPRAPAVALGLLALLPAALLLNDALLGWSWFRYGTPLLDPASSSLAVMSRA